MEGLLGAARLGLLRSKLCGGGGGVRYGGLSTGFLVRR